MANKMNLNEARFYSLNMRGAILSMSDYISELMVSDTGDSILVDTKLGRVGIEEKGKAIKEGDWCYTIEDIPSIIRSIA